MQSPDLLLVDLAHAGLGYGVHDLVDIRGAVFRDLPFLSALLHELFQGVRVDAALPERYRVRTGNRARDLEKSPKRIFTSSARAYSKPFAVRRTGHRPRASRVRYRYNDTKIMVSKWGGGISSFCRGKGAAGGGEPEMPARTPVRRDKKVVVYKWKNKNGSYTFSNIPNTEGPSETVEIKPFENVVHYND